MPIPFDRFRLLNETEKPIKKATFKWHPEARIAAEEELLDNFKLADENDMMAPQTTRVFDAPIFDVKNIATMKLTVELVDQGPSRKLKTWEVFYPEMGGDPEANMVTFVDLFVRRFPGEPRSTDGHPEYYALMRLTFQNGSTWDYFSPKFD